MVTVLEKKSENGHVMRVDWHKAHNVKQALEVLHAMEAQDKSLQSVSEEERDELMLDIEEALDTDFRICYHCFE
ncbi:MAG TPA: hypothetical protein DDY13_01060 [Cytophagales bacterium]|jgi:Tat protein secretion system quality control protein TatD with DNase activity|nr:hypothetical protein [Cytophagales bacterium]